MENVLVDNKPLAYRCPNETEPDGLKCTGILVFGPGEMMQCCKTCGAWTGIAAPDLVQLTTQVGAVTGARDKWTVTVARHRSSFRNVLEIECGVDKCHFKRQLEAYRVHASGINFMMDEHPCPTPAPTDEPEALPEAKDSADQ